MGWSDAFALVGSIGVVCGFFGWLVYVIHKYPQDKP